MLRRARWLLVGTAVAAVLPVGCGDEATPEAGTLSGEVHVFAASSLTEAFGEMGTAFVAAHPRVKVTFNFAASSALARQIIEGGPADVFVSANETSMKRVTDTGKANGPQVVARNRLAIVVEKGNPKRITGLRDLAKPGVVVVLCAPEVPCGRLAAAALTKAGVSAKPASLEENVKAVVSKVILGEADAGIVYVTDVRAAGTNAAGVDIDIDIAGDPALEAVYLVAVTSASTNRQAAQAWVEFVLSHDGQATLARFGFLPP